MYNAGSYDDGEGEAQGGEQVCNTKQFCGYCVICVQAAAGDDDDEYEDDEDDDDVPLNYLVEKDLQVG